MGTEADEALRIPAPELERAVLQAITEFLEDDGQVLDALDEPSAQQVQLALRQAKALADALDTTPARMTTIQALIDRITISTNQLQISVKAGAIGGSRKVTIEVPVQLKRSGIAMRLVVRSGAVPSAPQVDAKLVGLISKAQDWFAQLASGRCSGVGEIAEQSNVSTSYVMRVMYLAFLAPDIVEKIVAGDGPIDPTAERLRRMEPLPMDWQAQRELLGLT